MSGDSANGSPTVGREDGVRRHVRTNGRIAQHLFSIENGKASPTISPQLSDEDDTNAKQCDRRLGDPADLHAALCSSTDVKRDHSPTTEGSYKNQPLSPTEDSKVFRPALTLEARKISHSRSTSEIGLSTMVPTLFRSCSTSNSPEDSDLDDEDLEIKPPLLRKKSGELVKPALRPPSRRRPSSVPGTPTFSKAVHFNEDIEQVCHFLQVDKPIAVSAGVSPAEQCDSESEYPLTQETSSRNFRTVSWEIRMANFPDDTPSKRTAPVTLERLYLSTDQKTLIGTALVANIAYHKTVVARFTFDYWKTTSEVMAEYIADVRNEYNGDGRDRFSFNIRLSDQANLETKTLLMCVRYNSGGQEHWDSNNFMNFQVDFIKRLAPANTTPSLGSRPTGAIPRSRAGRNASGKPRPVSMPVGAYDEDVGGIFDSKFQFGEPKRDFISPQMMTIKFKDNKAATATIADADRGHAQPSTRQAFSTRYDFGASLSAALSKAQDVLGDNSGLKAKKALQPGSGHFTQSKSIESSFGRPASKPTAAFSVEKPALKSAEYDELIQKYCFFGSGKSPALEDGAKDVAPPPADGAQDESDGSGDNTKSSVLNSPQVSQLDGSNDGKSVAAVPSHKVFLPRSTSPGPITGTSLSSRTQSPVSFGYPYPHSMHSGGIFPESQTPQAIRG